MTNTFFVTADWLSAHLSDDDIQLIDARMPPAGQENLRDIHAEFIASHLPGALFFDIDALSDHSSPLPHMMPSAEKFSADMQALGVNQENIWWYTTKETCSQPRVRGGCCAPLAQTRFPF